MDNISNSDSCIGQITKYKKEENKIEEDIDPKQLAEDCNVLDAEINYLTNKVIEKVNIRYNLKADKQTYDQLINLQNSLKELN